STSRRESAPDGIFGNDNQNDAMILPYDANPRRMEFSEKTRADYSLQLDVNFIKLQIASRCGPLRFPFLVPSGFESPLRVSLSNSDLAAVPLRPCSRRGPGQKRT